jgi:hypothetical protein
MTGGRPGSALAAFLAVSALLLAVPAAPSRAEEPKTEDGAKVLGLSFRGRHRAYPVNLFSPPRVVSDSIRQQEVVVFHDPALDISTAYFRMVIGEPIEFSSSVDGTVADDLTTITRWDLSSGKAVGGNLTGMELISLPVTLTSWAEWFASHPDTDVFSPDSP